MSEILTPPILISFSIGFSLGLIIGIIFMRVVQKSSLVPLLNGVASVMFLGVNIYGMIYTREIPNIFNVTLALAFAATSGLNLIKHLPILSLGNK